MIFKKKYIEKITTGQKTQTSRLKPPRYKVGSIQPCKASWFGEPFAYIKILRIWTRKVNDMMPSDLLAEGGYTKKLDFVRELMAINKMGLKEVMDTTWWTIEFVSVDISGQTALNCYLGKRDG